MSDVPDGYRRNAGTCPPEAKGKRVLVILGNGRHGSYDTGPMSPKGWPADGKDGCRWFITGDEWDIAFWKLAS